MKYVTIKRFKRKGIGGDFNIPWNTAVQEIDGVLYYQNRPVCIANSYASHQHFSINDDGMGQERGKLSHKIIKELDGMHKDSLKWNAVFNDDIAKRYRQKEHIDFWLWDNSFFQAPIEDLEHIFLLINKKTS